MLNNVPYKTKHFLFVLIKLSIVAGALYFIYTRLTENESLSFGTFINLLTKEDRFTTIDLLVISLLTDLNWLFEALKWQSLAKNVKAISTINALEQSLAGVTASMITPNRLGDYGAKAAFYQKGQRGKIVLLNLLGHVSQMTITTVLGLIGLSIFITTYQIDINYLWVLKLLVMLGMLSLFSLFMVRQTKFTIKGYTPDQIKNYVKSLPYRSHVLNIGLALLRYLIFSFQFYYLLQIFGVDLNYFDAMVLITSMYLLASVIPTISFFDVVIKGSVAVFLFGFADVDESIILTITTLMWVLNFAIPSLFGGYFVLNFKLPESNS